MNDMTYKGYRARVCHDAEDEPFCGHIAGIRDRVGFHAETVGDLRAAFCEAVDDYLQTRETIGKTPDKPRRDASTSRDVARFTGRS